MCDIFQKAINGQYPDEINDLITGYLVTGEISLPSRSSFLKRQRDDLIRTTYEMLNEPPIPEYYEALMDSRILASGEQQDQIVLMLSSIHALSKKYNLDIPCQRTIRRIVTL